MFKLPSECLHPDVKISPVPTEEEVKQHVYDMLSFHGIDRHQVTKMEFPGDGFVHVEFVPRAPIEMIHIETVIPNVKDNKQGSQDPTGS